MGRVMKGYDEIEELGWGERSLEDEGEGKEGAIRSITGLVGWPSRS